MKVLLTGGRGMLARSIRSAWSDKNAELVAVGRSDVDLTDARATREMLERIGPDVIVHTAAKVGGIAANLGDQSSFLMENLLIDSSVMKGAFDLGVKNFVYIGSSCMYPKDFRQPLVESDVLAAPLEPTNEGYAIAKIAGARYCGYLSAQFDVDYKVVVPSNLYGPDDDYSLAHGHLVAAAIRKAHDAKRTGARSIDVWGDGTARREFTYVGDVSQWIATALPSLSSWPSLMNLGFGQDHSVLDYYRYALEVVEYDCELVTDPSKPAGMQMKLMDSTQAKRFGWAPSMGMVEGMRVAYARFLASEGRSKG